MRLHTVALSVRLIRSARWLFRTSMVSPSRMETTEPVKSPATENEGTDVRVSAKMKSIEQDSATSPVLDPAHIGACHVFINADVLG